MIVVGNRLRNKDKKCMSPEENCKDNPVIRDSHDVGGWSKLVYVKLHGA